MSLDVYLTLPGVQGVAGRHIFVRDEGQVRSVTREEWDHLYPGREPVVVEIASDDEVVFSANITHNLGRMATEAGIYQACWRPEELGFTKGGDLVPLLREGLSIMKTRPEHFKKFNASNGWGLYENFVPWVERYLEACERWPEAVVSVSR